MIPANFPLENLSAIEQVKVRAYCQRFTQDYYVEYKVGHFVLAAYAAVPALLTPDMLYKLWQNFNAYSWQGHQHFIHRVAVADLLLSPLCQEVGYELYEMNNDIRLAFLQWLDLIHQPKVSMKEAGRWETWANRGLFTADDLTAFVQHYHLVPSQASIRWGKDYVEVQLEEALSHNAPSTYVHQLYQRLYEALRADRESDVLYILRAMKRTRDKWEQLDDAGSLPARLQLVRDEDWIRALEASLQQNNGTLVELLERNTALWDHFVTDRPVGRTSIPIRLTDQAAPTYEQNKERRLRIFIVAMSEGQYADMPDLNSARLFEQTLQSVAGGRTEFFRVKGEKTKKNILTQWTVMLKGTRPQDDIIFYLAGDGIAEGDHCSVVCPDNEWLRDDEIHQATTTAFYHSMTFVLQVDHANTPYWGSPDKTNHIVFAACEQGQPASMLTVGEGAGRVCLFTYSLCQALVEAGNTRLSNREVFSRLLMQYDSQAFATTQASGGVMRAGLEVHGNRWSVKTPALRCAAPALHYFFARGYNFIVELQTLLFNQGLLEMPLSGRKDPLMLQALEIYRKRHGLSQRMSYETYMDSLREEQSQRKRGSLLIFSDPQGRLKIQEEYKAVRQLIDESHGDPMVSIIHPSSANAVRHTLTHETDVYSLIYYSGTYVDGGWVFGEEKMFMPEIMALLQYQPGVRILVSNTCESDLVARYAAQVGVRHAVGVRGLISDDLAVNFGLQFFKWFFRGVDKALAVEEFLRVFIDTNHRNYGAALVYHRGMAPELRSVPVPLQALTAKRITEKEFKWFANRVYDERPVMVKDDQQKGRWGGRSEVEGHRLVARVNPAREKGYYKVDITVQAPPSAGGEYAAVYLHDTFLDDLRILKLTRGKATVNLSRVHQAFTVGALLSNNITLELDLNDLEDCPAGFYYTRDEFRIRAKKLYNKVKSRKPATGKWGGERVVRGKELVVRVQSGDLPGRYEVTLSVLPVLDEGALSSKPISGDVAFFFEDPRLGGVRFVRAVAGAASIKVIAAKTFMAAAYTEDGTLLELDLNDVGHLPTDFYDWGSKIVSVPIARMEAQNPAVRAEDFVPGLKLRYPEGRFLKPHGFDPVRAHEDVAYFSNKAIVVFKADVSNEAREDVLYSTLLAQLHADKVVLDVGRRMDDWGKVYHDVLREIGWVINSNPAQVRNEEGISLGIADGIAEVMASAFGVPDTIAAKSVLEAIKIWDGDRQNTVFDKNTSSVNRRFFQMLIARQPDVGEVTLAVATFSVGSKSKLTRVLSQVLASGTVQLIYTTSVCTFNQELYSAKFRQQVRAKLGPKIGSYISKIHLR